MTIKFSNLAAPIIVNNKAIKNRVVVPPMADFGMTARDGLVNERHLQHYSAFADGGAGLIITEACVVSNMNEPRNTIGIFVDSCIQGMSLLAELVRGTSMDADALR